MGSSSTRQRFTQHHQRPALHRALGNLQDMQQRCLWDRGEGRQYIDSLVNYILWYMMTRWDRKQGREKCGPGKIFR